MLEARYTDRHFSSPLASREHREYRPNDITLIREANYSQITESEDYIQGCASSKAEQFMDRKSHTKVKHVKLKDWI
jgi:hypothetical protein